MNNISIALSAIFMLCIAAYMAPNIIAMNRGKILRNIALWLAIFAGLGLFYQYFGPGKGQFIQTAPAVQSDETPAPTGKDNGGHGFTPPKD